MCHLWANLPSMGKCAIYGQMSHLTSSFIIISVCLFTLKDIIHNKIIMSCSSQEYKVLESQSHNNWSLKVRNIGKWDLNKCSICVIPSTLVLWFVCTCACAKPFPKIVPMAKLDSPTTTQGTKPQQMGPQQLQGLEAWDPPYSFYGSQQLKLYPM